MRAKARVAILISGSGTNMAALLYASRAPSCSYEVVLVASNNPDAGGLKLAAAEGVPTFCLSHKGMDREAHDRAMDAAIRASGADHVALAGYMRILTPAFVRGWEGLHTHQRALDAGDRVCGCSVHLVTAELDDGPVLGQTEVAIIPGDTADTLAARVLIAEHQLYSRALSDYVSREADPDWIVAKVGQLALALPETDARPSHGAPGWRVGGEKTGKYFAYVSIHHHGEAPIALLVKTSGADEQAALIDSDPELYYLPKFYAPSGWIAIRLDTGRTDWDHITDWLSRSWRSVAPKRLTRMMAIAAEF
jgi:phosphoribosylglycinamide formyltransferase 1